MPATDVLSRGFVSTSKRTIPYDAYRKVLVWDRSRRDNQGNLILAPHEHTRIKNVIRVSRSFETRENDNNWWNGQVTSPEKLLPSNLRANAYNQAYARLRKKLYVGSASLGVTFASYTQSKDMILNRYNQLNQRADVMLADLSRRISPKKAASAHLEIIFGWVPLLQDIDASMNTVVQEAFPPFAVTGRAKYTHASKFAELRSANPSVILNHDVLAQGRVTLSAQVRVDNPNLWLVERAGLLNLGAVAWDLVPWSFVVNMFVNTGQLVNQLTDFTGLTLLGVSRTYNEHIMDVAKLRKRASYWYPGNFEVDYVQLSSPKTRTLHATPPSVNLQFKLPGVDVGLIAMSASLFTQKFSAISRFVSPFLKKK